MTQTIPSKAMNLIHDPWIPVLLQDGTRTRIHPAQIADPGNPPVALNASRADYNGALAQFLIGLLQTCLAPRDEGEWEDRLMESPTVAELVDAFSKYEAAFEVYGDGPRFMQDSEPFTQGEKEIAALLIEAPGDNTLRNNADHFIKRGHVAALCPACAVTALFTLQLNAPTGGAGHRTSLRGGGPLTTLVAPDPEGSGLPDTLWHQTWLNVLPKTVRLTGNPRLDRPEHIFPWLAPTRTSEKGGQETTPEDAHPYQMYWAMPRRIRLDLNRTVEGHCDLCQQGGELLAHYYTLNYGINYTGAWRHPLSPYREQQKGEPIPEPPRPGGITYRHWLGLVYAEPDGKQRITPAIVVDDFLNNKKTDKEQFRLWAFGYDMDKMKPRCWYEAILPLYQVPAKIRRDFEKRVAQLIEAAEYVARLLRSRIKEAWFKRPGDVRGDLGFLADAFFQHTESDFYALLPQFIATLNGGNDRSLLQRWLQILARAALELFDGQAASENLAFADPARVAVARNNLIKQLHGLKLKKILTLPKPKEKAA